MRAKSDLLPIDEKAELTEIGARATQAHRADPSVSSFGPTKIEIATCQRHALAVARSEFVSQNVNEGDRPLDVHSSV